MRSSLGTTEHVRGTSPFYMIELLRSHHVWALWLFWASCFGAFSYLLFHSDDMQYHCYSFCNTTSLRPCSLLSASNGSDISWNSMGSNCFNPSESANWTSAGSVTMSSSSSIQAVDVVPDMRAVGRRYSRFVLRFLDGEYTYVSSSLFANTSFAPRVKSLVVAQIDASSSVGDELVPLATPVVLESKAFSNIFTSGDSDIVLELPIGYRFPEGTQQLVIEFPGGPPLVPLVGNATVNTSSVQLTFATSSPTYLMYEVLARYVLLGATCVVVLLVLCLHALADTAVYDVFHPSVPSFDRWLACFSAVSFVTERESLLWDVWPRQPMFVKSVLISLAIMTLLCDPLVGAFYAFPENVVLQFWSMNLMPWLRFSWMVLTSSWLLACLMTCGDRGRMYAAASSIIPASIMKMANATTETTEIQGGSSASVVPLPASLIEPHSGEERSTILSAAFKSRLFLILLALGPPAFYFGSVVAAGRDGDPSQPSAVGRGHGKGMIGSVIAVEIYPPTLLFLVWYYAQRSLYARYPKGVADASPYPPAFGVPSVKGNGRAFVIAVRFLLPFCVWASVYMSATYFGTLQGLSKLLPSYDNGHLVEVLLNVLIGWTIAIIVVPVRKSMQLFPPRPSVYPPPTLPSDDAAAASDDVAMTDVSGVSSSVPKYDPSVQLWCQIPWTSTYFQRLLSGKMPNCGYAFRTEAHEIAFHRIQSTVVEPPPPKPKIRRTFVVGQRRLAITAIKTIPAVRRSFFCWETAVRCLNMSNEAYLDVSGDVDLSYYAAAEPYDHSCCESCIETGCCCFWPTFMGGGCAPIDVGDDRDVIPGDAGEGGHGGDEDEGHLPMSQSNRRFTEAGAVAEDASRLSDKNFFHRIRTQDELTSYVHQQDGGEDQDASTTRPSSVAAQPRLAIRAESPSTPPPPSQAGDVIPSISCQSLNSDTPILAKSSAPPGQPRNSNNTPGSLQNSVAVTPRSAMDVVLYKRQINVMRYGYQLVKVMDVYGVRILIAATPRGTTGRYPHLCIAFRGTVNLRNALTNVNASMSPYAEMNDKHAEAHSGFLLAFEQLLPTLISALNSFYFYESDGSQPVVTSWAQGLSRVICTGHSLGGGLAMLCAYSIAKGRLHQEIFSKLAARSTSTPSTPAARAPPSSSSTSGGGGALDSIQLRCYTYGSPSFSNSRFVDLFNDAVPETYRVVNENDIIPHVGFCWHAHAGREVRVNRDGDAIVEGTFLEKHYASLLQGVGSRFKNHLLARYGNSLDNCLCSRNLAVLSPDCCSCVMVHVE